MAMRARDLRRLIKNNSKRVSAQQMLDAVRGRQRERGGKMQCIAMDAGQKAYRIVSWEVWDKLIEKSKINTKRYRRNIRDCDDFAFSFRGEIPLLWEVNGVGFVLDTSGAHAYNVLIGYDSESDHISARFFEPQSDRFVEINSTEQGYEGYSAQRGYIFI